MWLGRYQKISHVAAVAAAAPIGARRATLVSQASSAKMNGSG